MDFVAITETVNFKNPIYGEGALTEGKTYYNSRFARETVKHGAGRTCLSSRSECAPCFDVFDKCPLGHQECRAFYHESIRPEIILNYMVHEIATHLYKMVSG